jgi:hypothetical protein
MRREIIWWTVFLAIVIFIAVRIPHITDNDIIHFYDTYSVIPFLLAILIITGIPTLTKTINKISDRLLTKSKRTVVLVLIINGLLELILILLIYLSVVNLFQIREWYPGIDISNYIAIVVVMTTALYLLTVIEIKTIKITTARE